MDLIDKMNLEELKNFFDMEHQRQEDLENYALRVKERDMLLQLNKLKIDRQAVKEKRDAMERDLADLMSDFTERKDIEIKARIEVDQIQK